MSEPSPQNVSILDVIQILGRRKLLLLSTFAILASVVLILVLIRHDTYMSEAKLFVRVGRESISLDPTATTGETLSLRTSREEEINSVLAIFRSRAVIEHTVDEIGADELLASKENYAWVAVVKDRIRSTKSVLKSWLSPSGRGGTPDNREEAVELLMDSTGIASPELSTVIAVSAKAKTPDLAQRIVETLVHICMEEHVRVNHTAGSHEFFQEQWELQRGRWMVKRRQLNEIKNEAGIGSIEAQFTLMEGKKSEIELLMMRTAAELAASQAKYDSLKSTLAEMEPTVLLQRVEGVHHVASDGMRQQLYTLEIQERDLEAKYDDAHPLLLAIRKQITDAREILDAQSSERVQSTYGYDPTWQKLQAELAQEESRLASWKATSQSLEAGHAIALQQLKELNKYALRHEELQSDVDQLQSNYQTYSDSLEQSRINHALELQRISNVNVVQQANLVSKPVGPSRTVLAGLGWLLALAASAAVAVLGDRLIMPAKTEPLAVAPRPQGDAVRSVSAESLAEVRSADEALEVTQG